MSELRIVSARITDMPKRMLDPMPEVIVALENGEEKSLFSYYPDEIQFSSAEFVGLTEAAGRNLKRKKDIAYLRS